MNNQNIIRGCWQLSKGHSQHDSSIEPLLDAIRCGFTLFDCGDIYLGVEELLGKAAKASGKKLRIHTKFVPDLDRLKEIDRSYIEQIIDRSRERLQVDCLDLVQFHWWDWNVKKYLYTMEVLSELKAKGKIAEIGLTNVSSQYLTEFIDRFEIYSLQIQASLFDKRIERGIGELCHDQKIKIFAYGTLLGGFLSEKWLNQEAPDLNQLENRSLVKYKLLIDGACGWNEFQRRLSVLYDLAMKYESDIANISIAAMLQSGKIDAAIVGLSPHNYSTQNQSLANLPTLETQDKEIIEGWACHLKGDAYEEERETNGVHAKVMKYNLNSS